MAKLVLLALLGFGAAELYLLVKTGQWFGAWVPVLGAFVGLMVGGSIIRHQGLKSINRLRAAMQTGAAAGDSAGAGLAGVAAGVLFIIPGFLSDAAALLLLLPVTRGLILRALLRNVRVVRTHHTVHRRPPGHGPVIDAEAIEIHEPGRNDESPDSPWKR